VTWRYQATRRTIKAAGMHDQEVFEVREVYDLYDDGTLSLTDDAIAPASGTKDGLVEVLQMMLRDVQELDVLEVGE